MSYKLNWLDAEPSEINDNCTTFDMAKIKEKFEVRELGPEAWLVLKDEPYDDGVKYSGWLRFAVLDFHCSDSDGSDLKCSLIFHGEGISGSLREPRHTYWGECSNGYLFYPKAEAIIAALEALKEFFDFN